jgi:hypothetical protein
LLSDNKDDSAIETLLMLTAISGGTFPGFPTAQTPQAGAGGGSGGKTTKPSGSGNP